MHTGKSGNEMNGERTTKVGSSEEADFANRAHEVSCGLCCLGVKMMLRNTEMEVTKRLDLVVMRVSMK
jgi:hypothetical protein